MSFLRSLWSFVKSHPIGSVVVFVVIVPLVFGGLALTIYRAVRGAAVKALPSAGNALPVK